MPASREIVGKIAWRTKEEKKKTEGEEGAGSLFLKRNQEGKGRGGPEESPALGIGREKRGGKKSKEKDYLLRLGKGEKQKVKAISGLNELLGEQTPAGTPQRPGQRGLRGKRESTR